MLSWKTPDRPETKLQDMPIQFKFKDKLPAPRRREIVRALSDAGFESRPLFPDQEREALKSMQIVASRSDGDLGAVRKALKRFAPEIDFVETTPIRRLK